MSLAYEKSTSRLKVHIVKARNLCCKALEGKKQDRCGVSCSGDLAIVTRNHLFRVKFTNNSFSCKLHATMMRAW